MADKYSAGRYCFFGGLGLAVAILFAPDSVPALAIESDARLMKHETW
jgi:hypothetical protein